METGSQPPQRSSASVRRSVFSLAKKKHFSEHVYYTSTAWCSLKNRCHSSRTGIAFHIQLRLAVGLQLFCEERYFIFILKKSKKYRINFYVEKKYGMDIYIRNISSQSFYIEGMINNKRVGGLKLEVKKKCLEMSLRVSLFANQKKKDS